MRQLCDHFFLLLWPGDSCSWKAQDAPTRGHKDVPAALSDYEPLPATDSAGKDTDESHIKVRPLLITFAWT